MTAHRCRTLRAYYPFRLVAPFVYTMWLTVATLYFATVVTSDPLRLATLAVVLEAANRHETAVHGLDQRACAF